MLHLDLVIDLVSIDMHHHGYKEFLEGCDTPEGLIHIRDQQTRTKILGPKNHIFDDFWLGCC